MTANLWIGFLAAAVLALGYVLVMRALYRQSRAADKQVDFSKLRPQQDEDGRD
jgi:hypothetical protein